MHAPARVLAISTTICYPYTMNASRYVHALNARGKVGSYVFRQFAGRVYRRAHTYAYPALTEYQEEIQYATKQIAAVWRSVKDNPAHLAAWSLFAQTKSWRCGPYEAIRRAFTPTFVGAPPPWGGDSLSRLSPTTLRYTAQLIPLWPRIPHTELFTLHTGAHPYALALVASATINPIGLTVRVDFHTTTPPGYFFQVRNWQRPSSGIGIIP